MMQMPMPWSPHISSRQGSLVASSKCRKCHHNSEPSVCTKNTVNPHSKCSSNNSFPSVRTRAARAISHPQHLTQHKNTFYLQILLQPDLSDPLHCICVSTLRSKTFMVHPHCLTHFSTHFSGLHISPSRTSIRMSPTEVKIQLFSRSFSLPDLWQEQLHGSSESWRKTRSRVRA